MGKNVITHIAAELVEQGEITRERIAEIAGENRNPAQVIWQLRQDGYVIDADRAYKARKWMYRGAYEGGHKIVDRVIEALNINGEVTRKELETMSSTESPSEIIRRVRRLRGIGVKVVRNIPGTRRAEAWALEDKSAGMDAHLRNRQRGSLEGPELETVKVKCMRCGADVNVDVWPGDSAPGHKLCCRCNAGSHEEAIDYKGKGHRGKSVIEKPVHEPCRVFRPGDRGFKERATACTPPREIKDRLSDKMANVSLNIKF
jgi:hypothetical protein